MRARNVILIGFALVAIFVVVSSQMYDRKRQDAHQMLDHCMASLRDVVGGDVTVETATVWPYDKPLPEEVDAVAASIKARDSAVPGEIFQPKVLVDFRVRGGPVGNALCRYAAKSYRSLMPNSVWLMEVVSAAPEARVPVHKPRLGMGENLKLDRSKERFLLLYRMMGPKVTVL